MQTAYTTIRTRPTWMLAFPSPCKFSPSYTSLLFTLPLNLARAEYLLYLAEEDPEIQLGLVFYWSS
jgi:hypothetical protein